MAPGWNATSVAPIAATIGQWFDRKRGLALNLALSGATVAGLVVAPALLAAIPRLGFAEAERLLVVIGLVLAAGAVALFVRRGPLSFGRRRGSGRAAWSRSGTGISGASRRPSPSC